MLILALVFLLVSIVFSMIGMGGGVLYVPILLFAGYGMSRAPGISLLLITATSLAALYGYSKNRRIDWKLAAVIDPPTDIMAFVGGYFNGLLPESLLSLVLAVVLMVAGTLMIRKPSPARSSACRQKKWWLWHRRFKGEQYTVHLPKVLTATALIGILSGMLGITGGMIKLPIMVLLCGVPMDIAVATSTVMVAVTALSGVAGHALHNQVEWSTGLILAIVAVIGGLVGSHISLSMNKEKLKRAFGVIVWLIAIRLLVHLWTGRL